MTKKATYINFMPIIVLVILILGAGYFLMRDDIDKIFKNEPQVRRLEGFPTAIDNVTFEERPRKVITNEQELIDFLKLIDPSGNSALSEKINFDRETLIGYASTTLEKDGSTMKIKKVIQDDDDEEIIFQVVQKVPNEDLCVKEPRTYITADIVAIRKSAIKEGYSIKFEYVKETQDDCNP